MFIWNKEELGLGMVLVWVECCHGAFGGQVLVLLSCAEQAETYQPVISQLFEFSKVRNPTLVLCSAPEAAQTCLVVVGDVMQRW